MRQAIFNTFAGLALMAGAGLASSAAWGQDTVVLEDPTADQFVEELTRGIRIGTGAGGEAAIEVEDAAIDAQVQSESPAVLTAPSIDFKVQFAFGSAELTPAARQTLNQLGAALLRDELQPFRFLLAGHTDAVGSDQSNLTLSQRRAEAVRSYLTSTFGVDPARLMSMGMGESDLADPANPNSGVNRRVEITNLGLIGG